MSEPIAKVESMLFAPLTFTMDRGVLPDFVGTAARLGQGTPGPAIWEVRAGELGLCWKGMSRRYDAVTPDDRAATFRIAARGMPALAKAVPPAGPVVVQVTDRGLTIDGFTVPCSHIPRNPGIVLPQRAGVLEVLLLPYRHSADALACAGLVDAVEAATDTLARAMDNFCEQTPWLQLSPDRMRELLEPHLRQLAKLPPEKPPTETRVVEIDPRGQMGLFDPTKS